MEEILLFLLPFILLQLGFPKQRWDSLLLDYEFGGGGMFLLKTIHSTNATTFITKNPTKNDTNTMIKLSFDISPYIYNIMSTIESIPKNITPRPKIYEV
jgi:hypothetical protein